MKNKHKSNKFLLLLAILFLLAGIVIFSYPTVSNALAVKDQVQVIDEYDKTVIQLGDNVDIDNELYKAKIYNDNLSGDPLHDPFIEGSGYALPENYTDVLNINGVIGYIKIPKIGVNLPIYHGTSNEVLEKGVGHVETTSFPIGGNTSQSVLTGHRGLPSAKLFTDLDKLSVGDHFYIYVLNQVYTYKIYEIETITPEQIDKIRMQQGRDLVTLVTCTPYAINTHRLLVHAERTEYIPEEVVEKDEQVKDIIRIDYNLIGLIIGIVLLLIFLSYMFINKKRKEKKIEQ